MNRSLRAISGSSPAPAGPRTALALRKDFKLADAVAMVNSQKGALNWCLVSPQVLPSPSARPRLAPGSSSGTPPSGTPPSDSTPAGS
jgi:hypothetical protein